MRPPVGTQTGGPCHSGPISCSFAVARGFGRVGVLAIFPCALGFGSSRRSLTVSRSRADALLTRRQPWGSGELNLLRE